MVCFQGRSILHSIKLDGGIFPPSKQQRAKWVLNCTGLGKFRGKNMGNRGNRGEIDKKIDKSGPLVHISVLIKSDCPM